jgi:mono/diheme cytochrome c family protein
MPKMHRKLKHAVVVLSALPFAISLALAETPAAKKGVSEAEVKYQAGGSPMANEPMHQNVDPKAPAMTEAEFDKAKRIFFERCAGCHGVLRKGATGKALTPDITLEKGLEYLKVFIKYGSPGGMPNWGTSGVLTDDEVDLMARYIQQTPPAPPEYGLKEMQATWKVMVPVDKRPKKKMNNLTSREPVLRDPARRRRDCADRRRQQEDRQHSQHRLRGAYLTHVGFRPLPVRDRPRCQDQPDRPLDGKTRHGRRNQGRHGGPLGGKFQGQGLRGQVRDCRHLLAAAVRDHGRRHPEAAQDRVYPRHDR